MSRAVLIASSLILLVPASRAQEQKPMVVTPSPLKQDAPPPAAPPPAEEVAIPESFPQARYEASWQKNPFLLKTAPIIQVQESWAKDFVLTSLAEIGGVFRVSIRNKVTGESKRLVQGDEGDSEYKVVSVNLQPNRKESSVELSKGTETATLKYDETQLVAQGRPNPGAAGPGVKAGAQMPGMPMIPGQVPTGATGAGRLQGVAPGGASGRAPAAGSSIPGRSLPPSLPSGAAYSAGAGYNSNVGAGRVAAPPVPTPTVRNTYSGPQPAANVAAGAAVAPNPLLPSLPTTAAPGSGVAGSSVNVGTPSLPIPLPGSTATESGKSTAVDPLSNNPSGATTPVTRRRTLIPAPGLPQ